MEHDSRWAAGPQGPAGAGSPSAPTIDRQTLLEWKVYPRDLRDELAAAVNGDARAAKRIPLFVHHLRQAQDRPWARYLMFCLTWQTARAHAEFTQGLQVEAVRRFFPGGELSCFTAPCPASIEEVQALHDVVMPPLTQLYVEFSAHVQSIDHVRA